MCGPFDLCLYYHLCLQGGYSNCANSAPLYPPTNPRLFPHTHVLSLHCQVPLSLHTHTSGTQTQTHTHVCIHNLREGKCVFFFFQSGGGYVILCWCVTDAPKECRPTQYAFLFIFMYIYIYLYIYICICICISIDVHIHMYKSLYVYIYI